MSSEPGAIGRVAAVDHHDPHGVLGAHAERGGVVVRAFRPGATGMRVLPKRGSAVEMQEVDGAGVFEAFLPRRKPPLDYRLEATWLDGSTFAYDDPYAFPPTLGERRPLPDRRGAARGALRRARGARARARGRTGHVVRGLGARCPLGQRRRRLQQLGRPRPPAADRSGRAASGSSSCPEIGTGSRYKYEIRHGNGAAAPEGRSPRLRRRAAARERLGRLPVAVRVGRRRLARERASAPRRWASRCRSTRCTSARGA